MEIQWTEPAVSDLEGIRNYIGRDSEYYASRFVSRIIEAVERLKDSNRKECPGGRGKNRPGTFV